jgi:hypothetical protein
MRSAVRRTSLLVLRRAGAFCTPARLHAVSCLGVRRRRDQSTTRARGQASAGATTHHSLPPSWWRGGALLPLMGARQVYRALPSTWSVRLVWLLSCLRGCIPGGVFVVRPAVEKGTAWRKYTL